MIFVTLISVVLFLVEKDTGNCIDSRGKPCTVGSQCMLRLSTNISATLAQCSLSESLKYMLSWDDENVSTLSRSEYYHEVTRTWTTSSTFSYTLEGLKETIGTLHCTLDKERHTKVKRETEFQSGQCDCKSLYICIVLASVLFLVFLLVVVAASVMFYCKGYLPRMLDDAYLPNPHFRYLTDDISLIYNQPSSLNVSPEYLDGNQLIQKIESNPANTILFLGKPGSGKTCLFQNILRKWGSGKILKKYTLLYFQLNYMANHELSRKELIDKIEFFVRHVTATMRCQKLIVILDGVNISLLHNTEENISLVGKALQENFVTFEEVKVWIGCRYVMDEETSVMPKDKPTVNFEECTESQLETMFDKLVSDIDKNPKGRRISKNTIWNQYQYQEKKNRKILSYPLTSLLLALIYFSKSNDKNKQIDAIFTFCSGKISDKNGALDRLIECGNWDLLACLIEAFTTDDEEHTTYVNTLHEKEMEFKFIDDDYPRRAVLHLCHNMKKQEREPISIQFSSRDPTFLKDYLPKVTTILIFSNAHLNDDCFHSLIKAAAKSCLKLQFCEGELPTKVKKISDVPKDLQVHHKRKDGVYFLNLKTGNWEKNEE